mmetsp:Transcript_27589/g.27812  ORF Transcript_27589/g.27812 Transcript_27589/m.27812 type:complete len:179 (-) Transcript_27589:472-1008(-)
MANDHKEAWKPKNHYSLTLKEVQEQLTPAEQYRHFLITAGKHERMLQRLEWTWSKNIRKWTRAALLIQSYQRGIFGRVLFETLKPTLVLRKEQRDAKKASKEALEAGDASSALCVVQSVRELDIELLMYEARLGYMLQQYDTSERAARRVLGDKLRERERKINSQIIWMRGTSYAAVW